MDHRNPQLEAEVRADPTDSARWLVYADWLAERGDPRAEIVTLGQQLLGGSLSSAEWYDRAPRYAALCRSLRWPDDHPRPPFDWRARFEGMFEELRDTPGVHLERATLGPPTDPDEIAHWRGVAGKAWPEGMDELYRQTSRVELAWTARRDDDDSFGGAIRIPPLSSVWDYASLEGELWFDFLEADHAFRDLRPIDRFVPEAYAVLYPVPPPTAPPATAPAKVAYHYCGEELTPTSLTYAAWLELLLRSRGVFYWLKLTLGPARGGSWVEDGFARARTLFPDFPLDRSGLEFPLPPGGGQGVG